MRRIFEGFLTVFGGVVLGLFVASSIIQHFVNQPNTNKLDDDVHPALVGIKNEVALYVVEMDGNHYLLFVSDKRDYPYLIVLVDCLPDNRIREYAEADLNEDGKIVNFHLEDQEIVYVNGSLFDRACKIIGTRPSKIIMENRQLDQGSLYEPKSGIRNETPLKIPPALKDAFRKANKKGF